MKLVGSRYFPAIGGILLAVFIFLFLADSIRKDPVSFALVDGTTISLGEMQGQVVLLNFWSTSCLPCMKEMPDIARLYQEYSGSGVEIIGVSMSYDRPDHVLAFRQKYQVPYKLSLDLASSLARYFNVDVIPATLLLSKQGKEVYRHNGIIDINDMRIRLNDLLNQPED